MTEKTKLGIIDDSVKTKISAAYKNVKEASPNFKSRSSQRILIAEITKALGGLNGEKRIICAEAPTGTGKSLAYLLATIPVVKYLGRTAIVSTGTVALQEQLIHRDIPQLKQKSGLDFKAVLAKGRGRYACNRNISDLANNDPNQAALDIDDPLAPAWMFKPSPDQVKVVMEMDDALIDERWNGDLDEWKGGEVDPKVRSAIVLGNSGCSGRNCPHISRCGFFKARGEMEDADVIVANHDLVLSDLALGGGVVLSQPEDTFYIFDEGHHLPAVALAQGAMEMPIRKSIKDNAKAPKTIISVMTSCGAKTHSIKLRSDDGKAFVRDLAGALTYVEEYVGDHFPKQKANSFTNKDAPEIWRFENGFAPSDLIQLVKNCLEPAKGLLQILDTCADELKEAIKAKQVTQEVATKLNKSLNHHRETVEGILDTVFSFIRSDVEGLPPIARWVERGKSMSGIEETTVNASPTSAAAMLKRDLLDKAAGVVVVSATLTSLGTFNRFAEQAGLRLDDGTIYLALPSPFNFQENGLLSVPLLAADPSNPAQHTKEVGEYLNHQIDRDEGTLVLFSSRKQMNDVIDILAKDLKNIVIAQGSMPKNAILDLHASRINSGKGSVIFGLASFSEGVDMPGRLCEHVIIAKLPFMVPTSPVDATYSEWLEAQGRNPFMEITVPDASIKLTQAVGRLIRTETDKGRVTLLDRRVVTKSYGKKMIASLPPFSVFIEQAQRIA